MHPNLRQQAPTYIHATLLELCLYIYYQQLLTQQLSLSYLHHFSKSDKQEYIGHECQLRELVVVGDIVTYILLGEISWEETILLTHGSCCDPTVIRVVYADRD